MIDSKAEANDRLGSNALSAESGVITDAELVAFLLLAKGPIAERNPDAVAAAEAQISALAEITEARALDASQQYVDASGCNGSFCAKQTALALTTAVVLWQVAGLHTAAAVTIVLAAAVFVYLPGDERMGQIDEQKFVSNFMSNIRA